MTTSLAEQLQRLAVPQTSLLKRDKTRPSLLFDAKEAATLRRETVYQIGLDGIDELIQKNAQFAEFKNNLFDMSSKGFERGVQTEDVNKKLDKLIRKFLLRLSPYFLLSCTHKALEWLVNRFLIHEYNREELLMLVMPYHECNIFVRVIQLMKFREKNDHWVFLKSLQKSGAHLTKQALLTHAANDVHFIKFVSKFVQLVVKVHEKPSLLTVAFNFYCAVFAGAIEFATPSINENLISQMLPCLLKGLNSDISDYCAASYVILSRLVVKATLSEAVLERFVVKISDVKAKSMRNEVGLVLLVLYQSQGHFETVPDKACDNFVEKLWILKVLEELQANGSLVEAFLGPLCKSFLLRGLRDDLEEYRGFVTAVLDIVKFSNGFLGVFIGMLLDAAKSKSAYPDAIKTWLTLIIETLERQYPEQFDREIYKILSSSEEGRINKRKKCLQRILQETMAHRGKFDVFDKLYHPNPQFRAEAIKYLALNLNKLRDGEKEMIKSSFLDRINDESPSVVQETLQLIEKTDVLEWETLKALLIRLANKCFKRMDEEWTEIAAKAVKMLVKNAQKDDLATFLAVFPYLLPYNKNQLVLAKELLESKFIQSNRLIKLEEIKRIRNETESEQFCNKIFDALKSDTNDTILEFVQLLAKIPNEERDVLHKYFAMLILSCILPQNSPVSIAVHVIEIFVEYFDSCEAKYEKSHALFHHHISQAKRGKFAVEAFLLCVKNVIQKTKKPKIALEKYDFMGGEENSRFFVTLTRALLSNNAANFRKYVKLFLDYFAQELEVRIGFLLNLSIAKNKALNDAIRINCLDLIIKELENSDMVTVDLIQNFVPFILGLLCQKSEVIRKKSFEIVGILQKSGGNSILDGVLAQKEEIILDEEQTALVLFNLLDNTGIKGKKAMEIARNRTFLLEITTDASTPKYLIANLLQVLSHINSITIFNEIAPVGLEILENNTEILNEVEAIILTKTLARFEASIAPKIGLNTKIYEFLTRALEKDHLRLKINGKEEFNTIRLLKQIDDDFFGHLSDVVQENLLDLLVLRATVTTNPEIQPFLISIFKKIELDAMFVLAGLTQMRDVISPKLDPSKLKRRKSFVPTIDILDTLEWRKGTTILEVLSDKKSLKNHRKLFTPLFELLKKCLDFDEQHAVEYPKQLLLSTILHCCQLNNASKRKDEHLGSTFNIELIVQCIRASQNPQTHHHALLVLAEAALIVPDQVLHNVIAIFTFMGSSVLRHDDVYSVQIIIKIMDTIIPLLLQKNTKALAMEKIAQVLRVFIDALLDVPEHRRMILYKKLLNQIGVETNLHLFLVLIVDSHVSSASRAKDANNGRKLEIAANLAREYHPEIVINACIELVKYLKELPDEIDDSLNTKFDINFRTPKQFRHFKYTLITFTASLLSSHDFVPKVAELEVRAIFELEEHFKALVIEILTFIQRVSKVFDRNTNTPQSQYWKIILHYSYDILDSVNALLNPQMFVLVIKGLMLHKLATVRRRALELLNSKLHHQVSFFEKGVEMEEIYSLVPPLVSIIQSVNEEGGQDLEVIVQTALLSLKLLVKVLAKEYPEKFAEILEFITGLVRQGKLEGNVLASMILCIAELCVNLRANAISSLPNFMPAILKLFKAQKHHESAGLLLMSTVTALQKIVDTLPLFLSPYMDKLLFELCLLCAKWGDDKKVPIVGKLAVLRDKIGTAIPARILIPAIGQVYALLLEKKAFNGLSALMEILGENFNTLKSSGEMNAVLPEVTALFLGVFEFRAQGHASFEESNEIEEVFVRAFTKLMLKLSESSFKPLFYKIYDWAVRGEARSENMITFYALCNGMAECLKGIFVLFVVHLLSNAASVLDQCNRVKSEDLYFGEEEGKTIVLLENALRTLKCACGHATHRFITKERFEVLMQPLVDQLENELGGLEELKKRNVELVTPAIVSFVMATHDDFLWKQLIYQVLLKMRNTSPEIRLIALHCLTEIVKKLGEDFMPLIPETIPFLAELLEDEEEHVEKECKRAVQEMEKVLGESLQKYF